MSDHRDKQVGVPGYRRHWRARELRATQFHWLVLGLIRTLDRLPVVPVSRGFLLQPTDLGEVASRMVELALAAPAGRVPDVGGPVVRTFADFARSYFEASGRRKRSVEVPVPGKIARALREGAQTAPDHRYGEIHWEEFLNRVLQREGDYNGGAFVDDGRDSRPARRGLLRGGLLFLARATARRAS